MATVVTSDPNPAAELEGFLQVMQSVADGKLLQRLGSVVGENAELKDRLGKLDTTYQHILETVGKFQADIAHGQAVCAQKEAEIETLKKDTLQAQGKLGKAEADLNQTKSEVDSLLSMVKGLDDDSQKLKNQLADQDTNRAAAVEARKEADKKLQATQSKLKSVSDDLENRTHELDEVRSLFAPMEELDEETMYVSSPTVS